MGINWGWNDDSGTKQISSLTKAQKDALKAQLASIGATVGDNSVLNGYTNKLGNSDVYDQIGAGRQFSALQDDARRAGQDAYNSLAAGATGRFSSAMNKGRLDTARNISEQVNALDMARMQMQAGSRKDAIQNQMAAILGANNMQNSLATAQTNQIMETVRPGMKSTLGDIASLASIGVLFK